jgi:DNA-binding CsgD family transcriptional regulator
MIDLSPRQREAVELYISGMTAADVATRLHLEQDTVKAYLDRIKDKFLRTGRAVSTRTELQTELARDGIITIGD